ncbi:MAG: hypothetical protein PHG16_05345 [Lachnospiraceae bacterium]|nr:hypothetical protein [Lachnospiraceae bacterium]
MQKEGISLIDLLKDLLKIFVYGTLEFFADITISNGTRGFIEKDKDSSSKCKRIFQRICFLITLLFIGFFLALGLLGFKHKKLGEALIAVLIAIGISFWLIVVKIDVKDKGRKK